MKKSLIRDFFLLFGPQIVKKSLRVGFFHYVAWPPYSEKDFFYCQKMPKITENTKYHQESQKSPRMPKITNNAKNDQILPKMPKFTKNEKDHQKYAKNPQKCKKSLKLINIRDVPQYQIDCFF